MTKKTPVTIQSITKSELSSTTWRSDFEDPDGLLKLNPRQRSVLLNNPMAKSDSDELMLVGELRRPYLGISGGEITSDLSSELGVSKGIVIASVAPGSPADQAGLRSFSPFRNGDVITEVDGRSVGTVEDMVGYFNSRRPGDEVTLSVFRNSRVVEVSVTLAQWPDS